MRSRPCSSICLRSRRIHASVIAVCCAVLLCSWSHLHTLLFVNFWPVRIDLPVRHDALVAAPACSVLRIDLLHVLRPRWEVVPVYGESGPRAPTTSHQLRCNWHLRICHLTGRDLRSRAPQLHAARRHTCQCIVHTECIPKRPQRQPVHSAVCVTKACLWLAVHVLYLLWVAVWCSKLSSVFGTSPPSRGTR